MKACIVAYWEDGTLEVFGPFASERAAETFNERLQDIQYMERTQVTIMHSSSRAKLRLEMKSLYDYVAE